MFFRELKLLDHLENLRKGMFCMQGDVISLFMDMIFKNDFESCLKNTSPAYLNNGWYYDGKKAILTLPDHDEFREPS